MTGNGTFYDGTSSVRQDVSVELGAALRILTRDGRLLAEWPYADLESMSAPDGLMRLGRRGDKVLARLEIRDPALAAEIDLRADTIDQTGKIEGRKRRVVIGWTVAATVSLLIVAFFGIPAIADKLAPIIPRSVEARLGKAVDAQVRGMLDKRNSGRDFECGHADAERPGRAAFDKLISRLEAAAGLPFPFEAFVVRKSDANAIALPGARIYVFEGLIGKAQSADEVAGVVAHEIGHIAHRDGTRSVLQAAGLSFLFGMLLGDFVGGGAVVVAAKTVLQSSYTRDVEGAADVYGVELMGKAGGDPRALGAILTRLGGATEPGMKILLDHPETKARVATINRLAQSKPATPLLTASEWAALKKICG